MSASPLISVEEALLRIGRGEMVIVVDDETRENEGDLVFAAEHVTPEAINFMATHGRGLICLALTEERVRQLALTMQATSHRSRFGTAFTQSVEARSGISTGISAADRALTIRVAIEEGADPKDLASPGHMFPLRARNGGVLVRPGHTEASVDLARLARCRPFGVICEIMRDDGEMARMDDLEIFGATHGLGIVTIAAIIEYRLAREPLVRRLASDTMTTSRGDFCVHLYGLTTDDDLSEKGRSNEGLGHMALVLGSAALAPDGIPLVRVHTHCVSGNVFRANACRCAFLLEESMCRIAEHGWGAIVYLQHRVEDHPDAHGDLVHRTVNTTTTFLDPNFKPVALRLSIAGRILADIGINRISLLAATEQRVSLLRLLGVEIVEQIALQR